jgi:hypothetical protein
MESLSRKSIRISSITEALLKSLRPELAQYGAGFIVDLLAHEQAGLPAPLPPNKRIEVGAKKRGQQLRGKPALNPKGRKPKTVAD